MFLTDKTHARRAVLYRLRGEQAQMVTPGSNRWVEISRAQLLQLTVVSHLYFEMVLEDRITWTSDPAKRTQLEEVFAAARESPETGSMDEVQRLLGLIPREKA